MGASPLAIRLMAAAAGTVLLGSAYATLQEPTFKGANRTVAVFATVSSADGHLVPDLPRTAFSILDNNKPVDISLFAHDTQPITVVMLLDRSGSMRANFRIVEEAAEAFVADLLPADRARVGSFADRIQIDPQDFTSSHATLLKILRSELQEAGPTPLWNAVNVGITALLHQEGRRVVLVFTDGVDNPMNFSGMNNSLKDVMKRAEEEDVMVYAIGLAGQNGPFGGGGRGPRGGPGGWPGGGPGGGGGGGRGGRGGGIGIGGGIGGIGGGMGRSGGRGGYGGRAESGPDEGLPKIAAATGGGYFELTTTSDLAETFKRVADELHHQYALGFTPLKLDGKMHTLDLRVGGTGLTARARRSYLARPAM